MSFNTPNAGPMVSGWRSDLEDPRRLERLAQPPRLLALLDFEPPEEIDPRPWHRIENQGSMGSCQGHALSSVGEMAYRIATGNITQFSPLFCYYATQKLDGLLGRDQGSTISGGVDCARQFGFCPLEVMPYPSPVRYTGRIPDDAWPAAAPFRMKSHTVCKTYDDAFRFLASGQGGLEVGMSWNSSVEPRNGVISQYRSGGGGHAVALLGYSSRKDTQGRHYLWLANSWSTNWGQAGWAEIAPSAIDAILDDSNALIVGQSDLTVPTPREIPWMKEPVL